MWTPRNSRHLLSYHLERTPECFREVWTREKGGGSNGDGPNSAETRRTAKGERCSQPASDAEFGLAGFLLFYGKTLERLNLHTLVAIL
jgi:hypothetical protein